MGKSLNTYADLLSFTSVVCQIYYEDSHFTCTEGVIQMYLNSLPFIIKQTWQVCHSRNKKKAASSLGLGLING